VNEEVQALLRERGYRLTPQRMVVLEVLGNEAGHLSAEAIHAKVAARFPYVNLSTIYRILEMLVTAGVATTAELGHGRRMFELAIAGGPHHHLVCTSCGKVDHIEARHLDDLEASLLREHKFEITETRLTSFGRCEDCRA
jgi:Fur family ferric uptake transcriptional regulator